MTGMPESHPQQSRRGDAEVLTIKPRHLSGRLEVFAHDDGGVTISQYDHLGLERERVALMREDWDRIKAFVEQSR